MVQVQKECPPNLSEKLSKRYCLNIQKANESSEAPPKVPQKTPLSYPIQAASPSTAASEPSYANTPRFVETDNAETGKCLCVN